MVAGNFKSSAVQFPEKPALLNISHAMRSQMDLDRESDAVPAPLIKTGITPGLETAPYRPNPYTLTPFHFGAVKAEAVFYTKASFETHSVVQGRRITIVPAAPGKLDDFTMVGLNLNTASPVFNEPTNHNKI